MCCFGKVADVVVPSPLPAAVPAAAAPAAPMSLADAREADKRITTLFEQAKIPEPLQQTFIRSFREQNGISLSAYMMMPPENRPEAVYNIRTGDVDAIRTIIRSDAELAATLRGMVSATATKAVPDTVAETDDAETEADTEADEEAEAADANANANADADPEADPEEFHRFPLTTLDGKEVQVGIAIDADGKTIMVDLDYLEGTMTLPALRDMAAQIAAEAEAELFEPVDNDDLTVSQLLILCLLSAIIGTITAYMAYIYRIY